MQITHWCNGDGLPDYPDKVDIKDVNVFMHDSGMMMTHDYSCPVCRKSAAVLDGSTGLMQPCWSCQNEGFELVRNDMRSWWQKLFNRI